jgi:predicted AAA+ superfamily ATPase
LVKIKNRESVLAESIVASHLARLYQEKIFFWKNSFEIDVLVIDSGLLRGFEVKWSEKSQARQLPQLKSFAIITKKEFARKPLKIPLSIFLMLLNI